VYFPYALPYVLTGLRLGMGRALRGMVVAELFIFSGALGQYLINSGSSLQISKLIAGIVFLSILGVIVLQGTRMIEASLLEYRDTEV
jgi:ABC-type nitrate/sulfonate/bicarbonate transport system permease component